MENIEQSENEGETRFPNWKEQQKCGAYECTSKGIYIDDKCVCHHPITLTATLLNIDTDLVKSEVSYYLNGHWKTCTVDNGTLMSKTKIIELANYGIDVSSDNANMLVRFLRYINNNNVLPIKSTISRLGWHDDEFIPFNGKYEYDGQGDFASTFKAINTPKGDLDTWKKACVQLVANNVPARVLVWGAFASVILTKLSIESFCIHCWGGSGTGKTVALLLAASVWGDPSHGKYYKTMNMTKNAMMRNASMLCNLPFCGDELQTIKKQYKGGYDDLIMQVTEGVDRERMSYTKVQTSEGWRNCFLFTGEEQCTSSRSGAGVLNRVIELQVDRNMLEGIVANEYCDVLFNNYGYVGREFLKMIPNWDLRGGFKRHYTTLNNLTHNNMTGKLLTNWSALLVVDDIISKWLDIEPLTFHNIEPHLIYQDTVDNSTRARDYLVSLITEQKAHFSDRLAAGGQWGGWFSDNPNHKGYVDPFGEYANLVDYVLIDSKVLEREMEKLGFRFDRKMKADWKRMEFLIPIGTDDRLTKKTTVNSAPAYYYRVQLTPIKKPTNNNL